MKRTLLAALAALLTVSFSAAAQDAEEEGNHLDFTLIPRIEGAVQSLNLDGGRQTSLGLANSTLSAVLEGNFTDNLYVYGQFVFADSDPKALYANSLRPDECTWVRMFLLTYSLGNLDISLGKDVLAFGGFEKSENEFDNYFDILSTSWHQIQPYLWGGNLSYNINEDNAVFFQAVNSPIVLDEEKPLAFQNGLFTFSAGWNGKMCDGWETKWSVTHMDTGETADTGLAVNYKMLSIGNRWTAGPWQFTLDLEARAQGAATMVNNEMTSVGEVRLKGGNFNAFAKFGWEFCHQTESNYFAFGEDKYIDGLIVPNILTPEKDLLFGGLGLEYYPLKDNDNLRLHLVGAANNFGGLSLTAGLTYFLNFRLF